MNETLLIIIVWALLPMAAVALVTMSRAPSRRERIATAALQGLLADSEDRSGEVRDGETCPEATARLALAHADALIHALDNTTEGMTQ